MPKVVLVYWRQGKLVPCYCRDPDYFCSVELRMVCHGWSLLGTSSSYPDLDWLCPVLIRLVSVVGDFWTLSFVSMDAKRFFDESEPIVDPSIASYLDLVCLARLCS